MNERIKIDQVIGKYVVLNFQNIYVYGWNVKFNSEFWNTLKGTSEKP